MCLAVPMLVVSVEGNHAVVESEGTRLTVGVELVENVRPGDSVIIHAGFALSKLGPEEAGETLAILKRLKETWKD